MTGALIERLSADARAAGAEIRTATELVRLEVSAGRVSGIVAADGWSVAADAVVVTAGPWTRRLLAGFDRRPGGAARRPGAVPLSRRRRHVLRNLTATEMLDRVDDQ